MAAVANNPAFAKKAGVPQSVGQDFTAADKGIKIPKSGARADLQKINNPKTNQGRNELFKEGGSTMKDDIKQDKAMIKKAFKQHDMQEHKGGKGTNLKLAKGGKAKRFDEGGDVEVGDANPSPEIETSELPAAASKPSSSTPSSFGAAFKAARASGDKTFEFNGKKYTTELASSSGPGRSPTGPKTPSGPGRSPTGAQKTVQSESTKNQAARRAKYSTDSVDRNTLLPKKMASGGSTGSFRSSANGIAQRGKTRGKMC